MTTRNQSEMVSDHQDYLPQNLSRRTINQLLCQVKFLKSIIVLNSVDTNLMEIEPEQITDHVKRVKKYMNYNSVDRNGSRLLFIGNNNADPEHEDDNIASFDSENEE